MRIFQSSSQSLEFNFEAPELSLIRLTRALQKCLAVDCEILFDHQIYTYQVDVLATSCRRHRRNLGLLWALCDNYLLIKLKVN
jgi:hypothetical protein